MEGLSKRPERWPSEHPYSRDAGALVVRQPWPGTAYARSGHEEGDSHHGTP